eukprot:136034_1
MAHKKAQIESLEALITTKQVNNEAGVQYYQNLLDYIKEDESKTKNKELHLAITKQHPHSYFGPSLKWLWIFNQGTAPGYENWMAGFNLKPIPKNTKSRPRKSMILKHKSQLKKNLSPKKTEPKTFIAIYAIQLNIFKNKYNKLKVYTKRGKKLLKPQINTLYRNIKKAINGEKPSNDLMMLIVACVLYYQLLPILPKEEEDEEQKKEQEQQTESRSILKDSISEWAPIIWKGWIALNQAIPIDQKRSYLCLEEVDDSPIRFKIIEIWKPIYKILWEFPPNKSRNLIIKNVNEYLLAYYGDDAPQIVPPKAQKLQTNINNNNNNNSLESLHQEQSSSDAVADTVEDTVHQEPSSQSSDVIAETFEDKTMQNIPFTLKDILVKIKIENCNNSVLCTTIEIASIIGTNELQAEFDSIVETSAKFGLSANADSISKVIINKATVIVAKSKTGQDIAEKIDNISDPKSEIVEENKESSDLSENSKQFMANYQWTKQRHDKFTEQLKAAKKVMITEAADNSCLYRSVSRFAYGSPEYWRQIQDIIVSYIEENATLFADFVLNEHGHGFSEYTKKARATGEWAGNHELQAAANIYECQVIVYYGDIKSCNIIKPTAGFEVKRNFQVAYCGNSHYNTVQEMDSKQKGLLNSDEIGLHESNLINLCNFINKKHKQSIEKDKDKKVDETKETEMFYKQLGTSNVCIWELLKNVTPLTKKALLTEKEICKYKTVGDIASDTKDNIIKYIKANKKKKK